MNLFFLSIAIFSAFNVFFDLSSNGETTIDERWEKFKDEFNKTYFAGLERIRKQLWAANVRIIERHNKEAEEGLHSYFLDTNHLTDLSSPQYIRRMVRLRRSRRRKVGDELLGATHADTPESVDWRKKGFQTPAWNQGLCGSCYAFSIAASIQGQIMKDKGKLQMLSAQQIVDCSTIVGNKGCMGGSLRNTMNYVHKYGLMAAKEYPYKAKGTKCHYKSQKIVANITDWNAVPARDEKALQVAVATMGPVAVSIDASPQTFQLYSKGIYDDPKCSSSHVNHAMLVVGYDKDAWILKNWWGKSWGEEGYMRLAKNKNRCGIANYAVYAIL
ncbi:procathepsin L [Ischnura elegans]|uniref:procathepsin L n=1 Tax=Ischnura elegans TaxID=197161 RepID=UPI001ED878DC|nr:procathepsin L [Ischnura elegans]